MVVRDIPFHSLCMHHLLAFHGVADVVTMQIANCVQQHLRPKGAGVVIEAEHLCMSLRGVQKAGTRTTISALLGLLRDDARTRQQFLSLVTA